MQEKNDDLQLRLNRNIDSMKDVEQENQELRSCIDEDQQVFKQVKNLQHEYVF